MTSHLAIMFWLSTLQVAPNFQVPIAPGVVGRGGNRGGAVGIPAPRPGGGAETDPNPARVAVSGVTAAQDVAEPLANVSLSFKQLYSAVGIPENVQVTSDSQGNFALGLVPGLYSISADLEGYLHQDRYQLGAGRPSESVITVVAGQRLDQIVVTMLAVPPITGIVYGADGQRLAAATVRAYRVQYSPHGRQFVLAASALSHEGGEYRLFHLTPGVYLVSASYSRLSQQASKSTLIFTRNLSDPDDGYSTIYYPSALDAADSKLVSVSNAIDSANIDIAFRESQYSRLTIHIAPLPTPGRTLRNPQVALLPMGADIGMALDYRIKGNGTDFSVDRLAHGDYVVVAIADFSDPSGNTYTSVVSDTKAVRLVGDAELTIDPLEPLDLPGSVTIESGGPIPREMKIKLIRADRFAARTVVADVDISGKFLLQNVGPGTYDIVVEGMQKSAYVRQIGFQFGDRQSGQIRVDSIRPNRILGPSGTRWISTEPLAAILTSGRSASGRVIDDGGRVFSGAKVVLVPNDSTARLRTDRYYIAFSDGSGMFHLDGVAPGSYTAYAFEALEPDIYYDSDFNRRMELRGKALITDRPVELTIIRTAELGR